jgi:hypothetical protein
VEVQLPEIVQAGIDTISFYLSLEGSPAIEKISKLPSRPVKYGGYLLGEETSWGGWGHWFGYTAIWRPERRRLYLHPKLVPDGQLCPIGELLDRTQNLIRRLAAIGIGSYGEPYVTRIDVAADGRFSCQRTAKNLLHAIHGCRVPGGGRTEAMGDPIGTVYVLSRSGRDKQARVYDKGREMRARAPRNERDALPQPYRLIRAESIQRFAPEQMPLRVVPLIARNLWRSRFTRIVPDEGGRSVVLPFDQIRGRIVQLVQRGALKPAQGERLRLFLELEATGEAESYYGAKQFSERRREARTRGLRVEDAGREAVDFDLGTIIASYDESAVWGPEIIDPLVAAAA